MALFSQDVVEVEERTAGREASWQGGWPFCHVFVAVMSSSTSPIHDNMAWPRMTLVIAEHLSARQLIVQSGLRSHLGFVLTSLPGAHEKMGGDTLFAHA